MIKLHGGSRYSYGRRFRVGDVIGCFMDANEKTLSKRRERKRVDELTFGRL